jgi:hypothetical protein
MAPGKLIIHILLYPIYNLISYLTVSAIAEHLSEDPRWENSWAC